MVIAPTDSFSVEISFLMFGEIQISFLASRSVNLTICSHLLRFIQFVGSNALQWPLRRENASLCVPIASELKFRLLNKFREFFGSETLRIDTQS